MERLDHVGIAVHNLDEALGRLLPVLGPRRVTREEVPSQKIRVAHIDMGNVSLELLESTAPDGPVGRFLSKRGEGLHHLSFEVSDIETRLVELRQAGVDMVDQTPRVGAEGHLIAFVHPKSTGGVLVELCQHREHAVDEPEVRRVTGEQE